jgi:hypothetical protein
MGTKTSTDTDRAAVTSVVLDYYEGWFDGDAARMERALHPELCKRSLDRDAAGGESLTTLTAQQMIGWTAEGVGKKRLQDVGDPRIEVMVDDIHGAIANVTVRSAIYREYVQLVRTSRGWKIANVLWDRA